MHEVFKQISKYHIRRLGFFLPKLGKLIDVKPDAIEKLSAGWELDSGYVAALSAIGMFCSGAETPSAQTNKANTDKQTDKKLFHQKRKPGF